MQTPSRAIRYVGCALITGAVVTLTLGMLLYSRIPLNGGADVLAAIFLFDRIYVDVLLVTLIGAWLVNLPGRNRFLGYLWFLLFASAFVIQLLSVFIGGEWVAVLAIDNLNHVNLLFDVRALIPIAVILAAVAALIWLTERPPVDRTASRKLTAISAALLLSALALHYSSHWLPTEWRSYRDAFYGSRHVYLTHKSPVQALYRVLFSRPNGPSTVLTADELIRARGYGMHINVNARYPLVKDWIYRRPLPMPDTGPRGLPNVIVFMSEGLAARTVSAYGAPPDLTPNIADFASHGMTVENYFNHTFATYRGLHGQFCSIFPVHGGIGGWHTEYRNLKNVSYHCLPAMLKPAGYRTIFLDTHRADAAFVDEMMGELGFDEVLTAEQISRRYLDGAEPKRDDSMSDNQLMTGLIGLLRELETASPEPPPFLVSLYNLQTHAWQRVSPDGRRYRDGGNYVLNTIHNYDAAFGEFWRYFQDSSLADDTIVVFTSDHTHYPDRDYVGIVGQDADYTPVFVDRIPMIIYDPGKNLPERYDARGASSIDFAPTLIHWLGLPNSSNHFLGRSVFDDREPTEAGPRSIAAAGGDDLFLIDSTGIHKQGHAAAASEVEVELAYLHRLMQALWQLERHNRIWPKAESR